jgi:hypothetical protein
VSRPSTARESPPPRVGSGVVPPLIVSAFGPVATDRYLRLLTEPDFLFREVDVCADCANKFKMTT